MIAAVEKLVEVAVREAVAKDRAAIVAFIRAEEARFGKQAEREVDTASDCKFARLRGAAAMARTLAAYIERGDHSQGEVMP